MPLSNPFAYIVCYDLKQPAYTYTPLFDELRQSYKWWHYLNSTWIVLRYEAMVELGPKLRALVFTDDRLLIMPAKGPADGWLTQDAWAWIRENIPNEW
jgi:hypothetical protein